MLRRLDYNELPKSGPANVSDSEVEQQLRVVATLEDGARLSFILELNSLGESSRPDTLHAEVRLVDGSWQESNSCDRCGVWQPNDQLYVWFPVKVEVTCTSWTRFKIVLPDKKQQLCKNMLLIEEATRRRRKGRRRRRRRGGTKRKELAKWRLLVKQPVEHEQDFVHLAAAMCLAHRKVRSYRSCQTSSSDCSLSASSSCSSSVVCCSQSARTRSSSTLTSAPLEDSSCSSMSSNSDWTCSSLTASSWTTACRCNRRQFSDQTTQTDESLVCSRCESNLVRSSSPAACSSVVERPSRTATSETATRRKDLRTTRLLSPMDFVLRGVAGGGDPMRTLSFTEASLSSQSSELVAQLAIAARSRSLCSESQMGSSGRLARLAEGKAKPELDPEPYQMAAVKASLGTNKAARCAGGFRRRLSRFTLDAISRIKRLSVSNPNIANQAPTSHKSSSGGGGGPAPSGRLRRLGSDSQQAPELLVVPHQLNKFLSRSSAELGAHKKIGARDGSGRDDRDEVDRDLGAYLYSPEGVYIGPGGQCTWSQVQSSGAVELDGAIRRRPTQPVVRAAQAPQIRVEQLGGPVKSATTNNSLSAYTTSVSSSCSLAAIEAAQQLNCESALRRTTSTTLQSTRTKTGQSGKSGKFAGQTEQSNDVPPLSDKCGLVSSAREQQERRGRCTKQQARDSKQDSGSVVKMAPQPSPSDDLLSGSGSRAGTLVTSRPASRPWILNLAQLVHSATTSKCGQPTNVTGRRPSGSAVQTAPKQRLVACESARFANGRRKSPPFLLKDGRSNSLSGLYLPGNLLELSKSSMDLSWSASSSNQVVAIGASVTVLEQMRLSDQRLVEGKQVDLAETTKPQTSTSQRALPPVEAPDSPELYGANLQTSCVHCQLISELSSHPQSAYLNQLLSGSRASERAPTLQEQTQDCSGPVQIPPSVVLTFCSNRGTLDDDDDDDENNDQDDEEEEDQNEDDDQEEEDAMDESEGDSSGRGRRRARLGSASSALSLLSRPDCSNEQASTCEQPSEASSSSSAADSSFPSEEDNDDLDEHEVDRCESSTNSQRGSSKSADETASNSSKSALSSPNVATRSPSAYTFLRTSGGSGAEDISQREKSSSSPSRRRRRKQTSRHHGGRRRSRRRRSKTQSGASASKKRAHKKADKVRRKRALPLPAASSPVYKVQTSRAQDEVFDSANVGLQVPPNKQNRSASLDTAYLLKVPARLDEEPGDGRPRRASDNQNQSSAGLEDELALAAKSNRSRSVDISLPVKPGGSYIVVQAGQSAGMVLKSSCVPGAETPSNELRHRLATGESMRIAALLKAAQSAALGEKTFIHGEVNVACANGETRALKLFTDWRSTCVNGEHLWIYAGSSSEACYVGESECLKHGPRLSCSACKIIAHTGCISTLIDKIKFICKHTFRDTTLLNSRQIREQQNVIYHHWVHKRNHCGRCKQCAKTFGNTKLPFSSKEIQAITCSWCKVSYHNKENCYTLSALTELCTLGPHRESIIPPLWILKVSDGNQDQQGSIDPGNIYGKENSEFLTARRHHINQSSDCDVKNLGSSNSTFPRGFGSSATLLTDTSGYISADNANLQFVQTREICDDSSKRNVNVPLGYRHENESLLDPSALQVSDLSILNQQINRTELVKSEDRPYTDEGAMTLVNAQAQESESQSVGPELSRQFYVNFRILPQPIQGIPNAGAKPVLVFVNPRSGGNQGAKMMQKFNWLLNPRQVFDLIQTCGPRAAIELYRDVPNLRILTIGGDGTASWILSDLDEAGIPNKIPVAVLPLGTGNDLARALGWGGGYTDEPIAKILTQIRDGEIVYLDRWNLSVERNFEVTPSSPSEYTSSANISSLSQQVVNMDVASPSITPAQSYFDSLYQGTNAVSTASMIDQQTSSCDTISAQNPPSVGQVFTGPPGVDEIGSDRLPMDVINNYFSFGVDAHIALEFHTAREAHPEKFSSRLRNKMFYGQAGGKDLLKRKWKDLSNFVTLYCDGQDMTYRLKELKVHSVLFLNIPSYGGGTRPWPTTAASSFVKPRTDDGLIEVIGLTTYQLPLLQAGGHGTCIAQCRYAKIITSRTIPMQVDGEPCKLLPSIININFRNRVCMLSKSKLSNKTANMTGGNMQKIIYV